MLKVKAPIELKCNSSRIPSYEAFVQRITGNYQLLQTSVTGEDLLHLVTEPPEIYLADGSVSTTLYQTNVSNSQEMKLEVINQLLNRISVDSGIHMTYQDRVYITDVLQKLGIRNVRQFMEQITQLKEETENTTELINRYWNHMEQLQQLIRYYRENREEKNEETQYRQEESVLHLHQDIMNRLQTGSIYQIVSNFNHNQSASASYISGDELKNLEYNRITRNILLNALENEARGENVPLEYRHENYYEEAFPVTEELTEEKITNRIAAAVLLQLADNLYQNRHENRSLHRNVWYTTANAFFRSAENTMNRLHRNLTEQYHRTERAGDQLIRQNESYRQELSFLEQIFLHGANAERQTRIAPSETNIGIENHLHYRAESADNRVENRFRQEENSFYDAETKNITEGNRYLEERSEQELYFDGSRDVYENTESNVRQEQQEVTLEQLEEFHRHNLENRNKYIQALQQLTQRQEKTHGAPETGRMQRESLQALEHPEELLAQLKEEGNRQREQKEQSIRQELSLLPEETQRIYEVLEQYLRTPAGMRQPETETNRNIGSLMREVELIEHSSREQEAAYTQTDRLQRETIETMLRERPAGDSGESVRSGRNAEAVSDAVYAEKPERAASDIRTTEREFRERELFYTESYSPVQEQLRMQTGYPQETVSGESLYRGKEPSETKKEEISEGTGETAADIRTREREFQEQELFYYENDTRLQRMTETVVERWEKNSGREPVRTRVSENSEQNSIRLIHKQQTENDVSEEIMEQLRNQSRLIENRSRVTEEVTNSSKTVERRVTNQTTQEISQQTENLTELINRDVQGKIGDITDQVYSRLEKRLQNERRRRGF